MRWPWRKAPEPESPEQELLRVLGAVHVIPPTGPGYFVYGLVGHDGVTFYTGQSGDILTRLGAHLKTYGDAIAEVWLVPVSSKWSMEVTEDFLIDRLQPRVNVHGTSNEADLIRERLARRRSERMRQQHLALAEQKAVAGE